LRVFVTGVAGFIGSSIASKLLYERHEVTGIDSFTDYYSPEIKRHNVADISENAAFKLVEQDLLDVNLKSLGDFDLVFHHAAQPGVRASWGTTFDTYVKNNILATQKLLEHFKSTKIEKFVYASSSSVYGNRSGIMSEEMPALPYSPYGATKLAGEHLCNIYNRNYSVPVVSLRYFTVFGPKQRPDMAFTRFISAVLGKKQITVFGDGKQTRDFTYIDDVVKATIDAAVSDASGIVMNIGGGHVVSVNDVIGMLEKIASERIEVKYDGKQKGDVEHTEASVEKAAKMIGYRPSVTVEKGLQRQFSYIQKNWDLYSPHT
jgi:UDP-glucose 4-epimerase